MQFLLQTLDMIFFKVFMIAIYLHGKRYWWIEQCCHGACQQVVTVAFQINRAIMDYNRSD